MNAADAEAYVVQLGQVMAQLALQVQGTVASAQALVNVFNSINPQVEEMRAKFLVMMSQNEEFRLEVAKLTEPVSRAKNSKAS